MKLDLKPGDVLRYGPCIGEMYGEAIVAYVDETKPAPIVLAAWRWMRDKSWITHYGLSSGLRWNDIEMHPDADRVRADYTAFILRGGTCNNV